MKILLDTDICIYAINRKRPEILAQVRDYRIGEVGISSITYTELRFGVESSVFCCHWTSSHSMPKQAGSTAGFAPNLSEAVVPSDRMTS